MNIHYRGHGSKDIIKRHYIKSKILMEVGFSFIFLLAKGAVVDLHVELRRADVEVEGYEEALMDVVVFCEL
jgi:hypothetical protein